jgi:hypothetical protein
LENRVNRAATGTAKGEVPVKRSVGAIAPASTKLDVSDTIPTIGDKTASTRDALPAGAGGNGGDAARNKLTIKPVSLGEATKHLISASQIPQNERATRSKLKRLLGIDQGALVIVLLIIGEAETSKEPMRVRLATESGTDEAPCCRPIVSLDGVFNHSFWE